MSHNANMNCYIKVRLELTAETIALSCTHGYLGCFFQSIYINREL